MTRRADCPLWCAGHVGDTSGLEHRVVVGDVRLTRVNDSGVRRTICAVRRRGGRNPADAARLSADLIAASGLLRQEGRRRRVRFEGNWAAPSHAELTMS